MLGLGNILTKGGALLGFPNKYSFNLDGSNDYLDFGDISLTGEFTLSAWIYLDSTSNMIIWGDSANADWFRITTATTADIKIANNSKNLWTHGATFTTGEWQHIAVVRNSSNQISIYRNGIHYNDNAPTRSGTFVPEYIGQKNSGNYFNGLIDEVAIWDTALSASDVAKLGSKPVDLTKYSASNLKLWLRAGDKVLPESDASIARSDFYLNFDGTDDEVRIKDYTGMSVGGSDHTITGWIKFNELNSDSGYTGIIYNGQSGSSNGHVGINPTNYLIGGTGNGTTWVTVEATASEGRFTTTGTWHHIAQVRQNNILYLYKDGVMVKSGNHSVTPDALDEEPAIGSGGGGEYFNGAVSNVGIYKTALPANDIALMAKSRFTPMRDNRFSVVDFDGVNDHINIDGLSFSGDEGTFAFWLNSTQVSAVKHLISIADADDGNTINLSFQANSGNLLGIYIGGWTRYTFSNHNDGQWHHVVFVLDGTSGTIYVDGVSETKTITSSLNIVNATKAKIGSDTAGTNRFYEGALSSVSIYNVAKTEEQVYALYQKGITYNESSESDLFAYYRMGDDTSKAYPTIADSSSNSNDGTASGAVEAQQMVAGYDLGSFESSSEELGVENIINGDFATGDFTGWSGNTSFDGTNGFVITDGACRLRSDGTNTSIYQNTLVDTKFYKLTFDITAITGTMKFVSYGNGESATNFTTTGTKTLYFNATGTYTYFQRKTACDVTFDNISVKEVLQSDLSDTYPAIIDVNEPVLGVDQVTNGTFDTDANWTKGTGWSIGSGVASCDGTQTGNTGLIQQGTISGANLDFEVGKTYKVTFDLTVTAGAITYVEVGGGADHNDISTTQNNVIRYITATSTNDRLTIAGNSTFEGTVDNVIVKEVSGNVGTMTNQDSADLVYSSVLPDQSFLTGVNSAYNFIDLDGSDQYISVQDDSSLTVSTALSVSTWINHDSTGSLQAYVTNWDYPNAGRSYRLYYTSGLKIELSAGGANDTKNITASFTPVVGSWYHIAFTFDSGTVKAYINGESQTVTADTGMHTSLYSSNGVTLIGAVGNESTNTHPMNGKIGQTSIFNKVLSSTEVGAIYNLTRHGNLLDSYSDNLVGNWAMSALDASTGLSDSISTVYDRSGNSNHGTPQNADAGDLKSSPNAEPNGYSKGDTNRSTTTP